MTENLMDDLIEVLKATNLSTYEINTFITLIKSSETSGLTARNITSKSNVPTGRIYEVLDELKNKGMIEVLGLRPKRYRSLTLNKALDNLITHQINENKRKATRLYQQAQVIESKLYESEMYVKKEPVRFFQSTAFGLQSISSMYSKFCDETRDEILFNDFITKSTLKILNRAQDFYTPVINALDRGVKVKVLWSFEFDDRTLTEEEKTRVSLMFAELVKTHENLFGLSKDETNFQMKYVHKKTTTYHDIFDRKRIVFKLQNPIKPYEVFSCVNLIDPRLAEELRKKFYQVWIYEALEG